MSLGQFLWASQTCKLSIFVLSGHGLLTYSSILPKYYLTLDDNVFKGSNIVNLPSSYWCIPFEENVGVSQCTLVHHGNSNPDPQSFDFQYMS